MGGRRYHTLEEAFRSGFEEGGPDECWLWNKHVRPNRRYGALVFMGRFFTPSRVSWTIANRGCPPTPGLFILHRCDNPPCVNPAHLFIGTHADNMADMVAKGRQGDGGAKLSEMDVQAIRIRRQLGYSYGRLGRFYGVVHETIRQIDIGNTWTRTGS